MTLKENGGSVVGARTSCYDRWHRPAPPVDHLRTPTHPSTFADFDTVGLTVARVTPCR